jgi:hypothetical protein
LIESGVQLQAFSDDGDEDVDRDDDPALGLDCVLAGAEKGLDAEMLFDPFEEQFDLPALFVDFSDGDCGQGEVVLGSP